MGQSHVWFVAVLSSLHRIDLTSVQDFSSKSTRNGVHKPTAFNAKSSDRTSRDSADASHSICGPALQQCAWNSSSNQWGVPLEQGRPRQNTRDRRDIDHEQLRKRGGLVKQVLSNAELPTLSVFGVLVQKGNIHFSICSLDKSQADCRCWIPFPVSSHLRMFEAERSSQNGMNR